MYPNTKKRIILTILIFFIAIFVAGAIKFAGDHPVSTIFKAGNEEKEVQLTFHPQDLKPEPGDLVNITPFLTAKAKKPGFISLSIRYDSIHLTFDGYDSTHLSDKYESLFPVEPVEKDVGGKKYGFIQLTYAIKDPSNLPSESIELSRISFKVKGRDKTSVTIDPKNTQIILSDEDTAEIILGHAAVDSQEKPIPTPTTLPIPSATPFLNPEPTITKIESTPTPLQVTPQSTIAPSQPTPTKVEPG